MSMMEEQTPQQSLEEIRIYHGELHHELAELLVDQKKHPTMYKYKRIVTISQRLNLPVQIDEPEDA